MKFEICSVAHRLGPDQPPYRRSGHWQENFWPDVLWMPKPKKNAE